jgi:hypothetical protein
MATKFFDDNHYRRISLQLSTHGWYSPRDSEWNYSDIPHLNFIHTRVAGITLKASKKHISNIFLQRIGPFEIPASVSISHRTRDIHSYIMTILNIAIEVETRHEGIGSGCVTTTQYNFYYKGFLGLLICLLARYSTRRNYSILMSEDMPMRTQRGKLRRKGVLFAHDKLELIGFSDTLNIAADNVDCRGAIPEKYAYRFRTSSIPGSVDIESCWLRVEWNNDFIRIYPAICPHEGAPLTQNIGETVSDHAECNAGIICPWHGRKVKEIAKMCLKNPQDLEFTLYHTKFIMSVEEYRTEGRGATSYLVLIRTKGPQAGCKPLGYYDKGDDHNLNGKKAW